MRMHAFVSRGWYPIEQLAQLHQAAMRACDKGPELSRALGREGILDDFRTGVNRLITLAITPESILKWAPRILGLYYDRGRIVVEESGDGRGMARFEGFDGFSRPVWEDSDRRLPRHARSRRRQDRQRARPLGGSGRRLAPGGRLPLDALSDALVLIRSRFAR